ncbi:MAG: radical SAM protein [Gemmatimonadetes bacterium]|nr:radical SAM protein [Gemmatimonadota bacterium]HNV75806.1 radical SAM protein [Gemmatimonadaceae bacterium]MBK6841787.1 radical SAM protein [Gemmatimonadota bacterium]MBK8061881.1 radical SAM protein [Gemmatimonadota bacterium]MBK9406833.1 radical SAM protein [Gemmatimonadota bacterium]
MLSSKYKPYHIPMFLAKYAWLVARRRPVLVHFEVTMRCNARCGFCDYWKTPADARETELKSFADAARYFNPMLVTFTGGEPLLRRDLEDLVSTVRDAIKLNYIMLITHGGMLSVERARSLWEAGVDQFNISLDYLDGRHDTARGIPGLTEKIFSTVAGMRAAGMHGIRFNAVIKNDNLDQLLPLVHRAAEVGAGVNFSVYTDFKNGNPDFLLQNGFARQAAEVIDELLAYKRKRRGIITNSDYYLEQIPRYLRGELREPCQSGIRTIHVDPTGQVKRCPDFPTDFHWTEFEQYREIDCNKCYYACRGEAQAPLRLSRVKDVFA